MIKSIASEVISRLVMEKSSIELIRSEINKKFSEDVRLTMIGVAEDELSNLSTTFVENVVNEVITSDEFIDRLAESLVRKFRMYSCPSSLNELVDEISSRIICRVNPLTSDMSDIRCWIENLNQRLVDVEGRLERGL